MHDSKGIMTLDKARYSLKLQHAGKNIGGLDLALLCLYSTCHGPQAMLMACMLSVVR